MANMDQQKYVIMGSRRGAKTRGLVSTLDEVNSVFRSGRITLERLKEKCSLALGGWIRAKPDWSFELVEVPRRQDFDTYSDYKTAHDKLYEV